MQQKWNQNFDGEPMTDIPQKFLNAGCDVYMVMQLRHDEKIFDERFASMRELNRRGKTPDPEHYEVTYYADLPAMWQDVPNNEVLEELFQMFNLSRPQDFEGHSLSVSDVIALKRNGEVSVHYVDSIATVHDAIHIRAVHQLLQNAKLLFGGRRHQILPLLRQDGQICDTPLDVFGIVDVGRCQFHQVPHAPADEITVALKVAVFAAGCAKDFCIGHSDGWLFRHD